MTTNRYRRPDRARGSAGGPPPAREGRAGAGGARARRGSGVASAPMHPRQSVEPVRADHNCGCRPGRELGTSRSRWSRVDGRRGRVVAGQGRGVTPRACRCGHWLGAHQQLPGAEGCERCPCPTFRPPLVGTRLGDASPVRVRVRGFPGPPGGRSAGGTRLGQRKHPGRGSGGAGNRADRNGPAAGCRPGAGGHRPWLADGHRGTRGVLGGGAAGRPILGRCAGVRVVIPG
jgi:hypothetical protein